MSKPFITRFAPSPTGHLHLGHAYSALLAHRSALKNGGDFILRIENIDQTRCRPEFEEGIYEDLVWLGLKWQRPVRRQSDHFDDFINVINKLENIGVLFKCFCTRAEIKAEIENSQSAPHGLEGPLYPGTCKNLSKAEITAREKGGLPFALRLNVGKAVEIIGSGLHFFEKGKKVLAQPETLGDVVLARKDTPTSYHLAVVVDDHLQGITHIIRGIDLSHTTHIHCLLQKLLGFETPEYFHHGLLTGPDGKRFAKRDKAMTLKSLREEGAVLADIETMIKGCGGRLSEVPF